MTNNERIVRYTLEELQAKPKPTIDWARIDALTEEDIDRAIAEDPDAAPALGPEFWENARLVMPSCKRKPQITIKIAPETLAWFKQQGKGYQSRINAVLDAYVAQMQRS